MEVYLCAFKLGEIPVGYTVMLESGNKILLDEFDFIKLVLTSFFWTNFPFTHDVNNESWF